MTRIRCRAGSRREVAQQFVALVAGPLPAPSSATRGVRLVDDHQLGAVVEELVPAVGAT